VPFSITFDPEQAGGILPLAIGIAAAVLTALTISMAIWAYRDMRTRTRDNVVQIMAAIVVALLNVPGLLIYLILRPQETLNEQYQRSLEEEALLREIEQRNVCPGCGAPTKENWRVCPFCHTKLRKPCENCDELLELAWSVCPFCEHVQGRSDHMPSSAARHAPGTVMRDGTTLGHDHDD